MSYKKFFSKKIVWVIVLVILLLGGSFFVLKKIVTDKDGMVALVISKVLVDYANNERWVKNISDLKTNELLEKAAFLKAQDMVSKGYFAHQSPDGHSPWYWLDQVGYDFSYAGENLAINFEESKDVNDAWMNSPKHKENILNGNFTEVGIAVVPGMYKGKMTTFVVQFFGKPAKKVFAESESPKKLSSVVSTASSTDQKLKFTASSTVLGASGENIIYTSVENEKNVVAKSFWKYILPSWIFN